MTLERRIAFAVFAVGVLIAIVALAACGDEDESPSPDPAPGEKPAESAKVSKACQKEGMVEQPYGAQALGPQGATVRMAYASGGSITPCAARLDGSTLVLLVLDPQISTMDLRIHCAEVNPEGADVTGVDDGTSSEQQAGGADKRALEDALAGNACVPVPIID